MSEELTMQDFEQELLVKDLFQYKADWLKAQIEKENTNSVSFGNARGIRNIFERVLVAQANRLAVDEDITREELMTLTAEDIQKAR